MTSSVGVAPPQEEQDNQLCITPLSPLNAAEIDPDCLGAQLENLKLKVSPELQSEISLVLDSLKGARCQLGLKSDPGRGFMPHAVHVNSGLTVGQERQVLG